MNWFQKLLFGNALNHLENRIMATVDQVKAVIQKEMGQVTDRVNTLEARIAELEAGGGGATPEQLQEIHDMVKGILPHADDDEQPE